MKNLCKEYLNLKKHKETVSERMLEIECELYVLNQEKLDTKDVGTFNFDNDGYSVKITKKETPSVDQELAEVIGLAFTKKYSLNKKDYEKLSVEDQKRVDECMTFKPAKPAFAIKEVEE